MSSAHTVFITNNGILLVIDSLLIASKTNPVTTASAVLFATVLVQLLK